MSDTAGPPTENDTGEPAQLDADEAEVQRLQQIIRDNRRVLDAAEPGTPAYQPALNAVLMATVELVNHEAGIPVRRREIYSARTADLVKRAALVAAASVALVTLLTLTPWLTAWWLLLLLPLLAVAAAVGVTARGATPSDRSTRRAAVRVMAAAVGVDLVLVVVSRWPPYWLTALLMSTATVGCLVAAWHLVGDVDLDESPETESEAEPG